MRMAEFENIRRPMKKWGMRQNFRTFLALLARWRV